MCINLLLDIPVVGSADVIISVLVVMLLIRDTVLTL